MPDTIDGQLVVGFNPIVLKGDKGDPGVAGGEGPTGPAGQDGSAVPVNDSTPSTDAVYSSQHVEDRLDQYAGPLGKTTATATAPLSYYNVVDFGATGDGTTDDAAACQAAIDAATTDGGGRVFFPAGTFLLGTTLSLSSGVTLFGRGQRISTLKVTDPAVSAVTILGTSPSVTIVQCAVQDLNLLGPGKTSGGTGNGVYIKWASVDTIVERCWVQQWGSDGIYAENSYSMTFRQCLLDSNGGNGFSGVTNINNTTFDRTVAIRNAGAGHKIDGGATDLFLNADAESNGTYGFDLRYTTASSLVGVHSENNTLASVYLHYHSSLSDKATATRVMNSLIQGSSVSPSGIIVDGASATYIDGCWFAGNTAEHVKTTSNADRTLIGRNTYTGTPTNGNLTDGSATTGTIDYDYSHLIPSVSPGLLFTPRTLNPASLSQGQVWMLSSTDQLKLRGASDIRIFATGYEGSATLDYPSIAASSTADLTVTVTGAVLGDLALPIIPAALEAGLGVERCWVSAAGTVTIRLRNYTAAAIDPASAGWKVFVVRY